MPAVSYVKLSVVHDAEGGYVTVFALNRHLTDAMPLQVATRGFSGLTLDRATQLRHDDLEATNTKERPENVRRAALGEVEVSGGVVKAQLPPASWNVIRLRVA